MPMRDDLLNPVPGSNPSGESLRYAAVYDQIKEGRREEEDINQGDWQRERKKADWALVTKLCSDAIAKKSKDLQLAAWLTEALVYREGFAGLKAGLDLIRGLLDGFWDTLYPEIEDDDVELRATPLDWIGTRLEDPLRKVALTSSGLDWRKYKESRSVPTEADSEGNESKQQVRNDAISDGKLTPEEFEEALRATPTASYQQWEEELDACLEAVRSLGDFCDEKFGRHAPSFINLRKTLEDLRQTIHMLLTRKRELEPPEPSAEAGSESASAGGWSESGAGAAPARAPQGVLAAEPADREDAIARIAVVARWFRQNDSYSPVPYMLVRALRWGELRAGGPDVDQTLLEPPATQTRQDLKRLALESDWAQVIEAAEAAAAKPCGRGWLDLQRYAVRALQESGYDACAKAISSGLRALLADYPQLPDMTLMDDTPTANPETKTWLAEILAPPVAQPSEEESLPPAAEQKSEEEPAAKPEADPYELAKQAARDGRPQEAIEILAQEAARAKCGRARFRRRVQLAQICLGAGHAKLAYPILASLAAEIDQRALEEWEPADMIAHPLTLLYRSMSKVDVTAEEKEKLYARICRIDPVQALTIAK